MDTTLSRGTMDTIKAILNSNLRPIEKLFLTIEWFLREQKPYELYDAKLVDIQRKAETFVKNQVPSELKREALKEATEIFQMMGDTRLFSLLTALAYYSYIVNEAVHDHDVREELLSKLPELGFSSSEINDLNAIWTKVIGSPEELFNRIFRE